MSVPAAYRFSLVIYYFVACSSYSSLPLLRNLSTEFPTFTRPGGPNFAHSFNRWLIYLSIGLMQRMFEVKCVIRDYVVLSINHLTIWKPIPYRRSASHRGKEGVKRWKKRCPACSRELLRNRGTMLKAPDWGISLTELSGPSANDAHFTVEVTDCKAHNSFFPVLWCAREWFWD